MKKTITILMLGAVLVACNRKEEPEIIQPETPTTYTLVIKASKSIETKALALSGKTLNAYWSGNEVIDVLQNDVKIGTATANASETGSTTISATLDSEPDPTNDLVFYLGGSTIAFTGQVGLLTGTDGNSISEKYDYAMDCIAGYSYYVNDHTVILNNNNSYTLEFVATQQAIIKFTLQDKGNSNAAINPSALTITDGSSTVELTSIPASTYTANGAGVLYIAFPTSGSAETFTLTATVGSDTYTYQTTSAKTFELGHYYEVKVKMTKVLTYPVALSTVTSDYVGSVVTTDGNVYATVADATNASKTAVAMIAYVSGTGDGLAFALEDANNGGEDYRSWDDASNCINSWASDKSVSGGTWRLPSVDDMQNMFIGCGSSDAHISMPEPTEGDEYFSETVHFDSSGFRSKLATAATNNLDVNAYWTSTDFYWWYMDEWFIDQTKHEAWTYRFDHGYSDDYFSSWPAQYDCLPVRACLAF